MSQIGMSQTQLDEIELRLVGADHRPWTLDSQLFDEAGRPLICKKVRSGRRDVPGVVDHRTFIKSLALFKLCDEASTEMAQFVVNAPQDIEALLSEVKFLRKRLRDAEVERDEFKKDMLTLRVEKSKLQENFSETRRVLRDLGKAIKECGS